MVLTLLKEFVVCFCGKGQPSATSLKLAFPDATAECSISPAGEEM
jgi:hypothetical protein